MLASFLTTNLFAFLLVFSRVGSGVMLMPGIGEAYVPARIRLLFALALTAALTPMLAAQFPAVPDQPLLMFLMVGKEVLVGVFLGAITRMLISAVHVAGTVIATQTGLAAAMMLDITQTSQSTAITNLLSMTAVTAMFATNLHHVLLAALAQSYEIFPAATAMPWQDTALYAGQTLSRAFGVGAQLAAPHIVIGTLLYLAAGVLARLMPNIQIFFILIAPQIMIGLFILMATVSGTMMWYMGYLQESLGKFVHLQ